MNWNTSFIMLVFLVCCSAHGQDELKLLFMEADSVYIASHDDLRVFSQGKIIAEREILSGGQPNGEIIKEKVKLDKEQSEVLYGILDSGIPGSLETLYCIFNPHHAIFLYKEGNCAAIDICFDCYQYSGTGNMRTVILRDRDAWLELRSFFEEKGLNYKLPGKGKRGY